MTEPGTDELAPLSLERGTHLQTLWVKQKTKNQDVLDLFLKRLQPVLVADEDDHGLGWNFPVLSSRALCLAVFETDADEVVTMVHHLLDSHVDSTVLKRHVKTVTYDGGKPLSQQETISFYTLNVDKWMADLSREQTERGIGDSYAPDIVPGRVAPAIDLEWSETVGTSDLPTAPDPIDLSATKYDDLPDDPPMPYEDPEPAVEPHTSVPPRKVVKKAYRPPVIVDDAIEEEPPF